MFQRPCLGGCHCRRGHAGRRPRGPLVAAAGAVVASLVAFHRTLFSWRSLLAMLLVVILFIPIRRYTLGGAGAFPARTVSPRRRVHHRRLACIAPRRPSSAHPQQRFRVAARLDRVLDTRIDRSNVGSIEALGVRADVIKSTLFFASFFFVLYVIRTGAPTLPDVDFLVKTLVSAGLWSPSRRSTRPERASTSSTISRASLRSFKSTSFQTASEISRLPARWQESCLRVS